MGVEMERQATEGFRLKGSPTQVYQFFMLNFALQNSLSATTSKDSSPRLPSSLLSKLLVQQLLPILDRNTSSYLLAEDQRTFF